MLAIQRPGTIVDGASTWVIRPREQSALTFDNTPMTFLEAERFGDPGMVSIAPHLDKSPLHRRNTARAILDNWIAGQPRAKAITLNVLGLLEHTPQSMVLTGPPGSGKLDLLYAMSEALNGSAHAHLKIDCSLGNEIVMRKLPSGPKKALDFVAPDNDVDEKFGKNDALILHFDKADEMSPALLENLAQYLVPLFTQKELHGRKYSGALIVSSGTDEAATQRLSHRIGVLAAAAKQPHIKPATAVFEAPTPDMLMKIAARTISTLMASLSEDPALAKATIEIDKKLLNHVTDLAYEGTRISGDPGAAVVTMLTDIFDALRVSVTEAVPGTHFRVAPHEDRGFKGYGILESYWIDLQARVP